MNGKEELKEVSKTIKSDDNSSRQGQYIRTFTGKQVDIWIQTHTSKYWHTHRTYMHTPYIRTVHTYCTFTCPYMHTVHTYIHTVRTYLGDKHVPFVRNVNFVMSGIAILRTSSQSILKSKKSHLRTPSSLSAVSRVRPSEEVSSKFCEPSRKWNRKRQRKEERKKKK